MGKPEKLSERALNNSIDSNWRQLLSATQIRRVVQTGFLTFGLLFAAALPLLNSEPDTPPETSTAKDGKDGKDGRDGRDGTDGKDGKDGKDLGGPVVTLPGGAAQTIKVLSRIEIRAAPASKLWHRSAFEKIGDEFWALPDSNFKLTLVAPLAAPCDKNDCKAIFEATFDQFPDVPASPYRIQLFKKKGAIRMLPPMPNVCKVIDDLTPYLLCQLKSKLPAPLSDVCLWLRRATKGESEKEIVALEIRWEKVDFNDDDENICGGEFSREEYTPISW